MATLHQEASQGLMGDSDKLIVRVLDGVAAVPAAVWDACANPPGASFDPFLSHAFFASLEASGSASAGTGWAPRHLALEDGQGGIAAILPLYLKSHSMGEFVFDHSWAAAIERAGGRYYPKLQAAVPFTPVTGRRFLVRHGADACAARNALLGGALQLLAAEKASSLHITFVEPGVWSDLGKQGLLQRSDSQFHWHNRGYASFDDFLADLASRKRKAIRKERREALEGRGLIIEWLTGPDIREHHWDAFFTFYMDTSARKWGRPYLNRRFFSLIGESMAEHILLVMAMREGRPVAGALNFIGSEALYGRYWGAIEEHPFLHFELCYYQAIDFAIARGLKRVEGGAQGEHKLARGYVPSPTYSLHHIADPGLRAGVARFLDHERREVEAEAEALRALAPFRKAPEGKV